MKKLLISLTIIFVVLGTLGVFIIDRIHKTEERSKVLAKEEFDKAELAAADLALEESKKPENIANKVKQLIKDKYKVDEFSDILFQNKDNQLGFLDSVEVNERETDKFEVVLEFHNLSTSTSKTQVKQAAEEVLEMTKGIPWVERVTGSVNNFSGKGSIEQSVERGVDE